MVFDKVSKIVVVPIYYLIHHNIIFGFIHKYLIKKFYYKNLRFNLDIDSIPIQNHSSFLFKTYEYNDRVLIERNITKKNKSIIIGGGIGFIPAIVHKYSKKKILIFEINKKILGNLEKNLKLNKCSYKLYNKNLSVKDKKLKKNFYLSKDFLASSSRIKTKSKIIVQNLDYRKVTSFNQFNTLVIDAEGDEEYYIRKIKFFKKIRYLFFELHFNIFNKNKVNKIMGILKKNGFVMKDKCFNSFYFVRKGEVWK